MDFGRGDCARAAGPWVRAKGALLSALACLALCLSVSTHASAADRCTNCHAKLPNEKLRAPALAVAESAHRDEQLGCPACHGGDRDDPTVRAHSAPSFVPHPAYKDIPQLCGGCHANAPFVRRFNATLPIDQLALYNTSVHGQRLADGDTHVAVCTSCHGVHDIARIADPRSRVHPSQVAATCGGCHADSQRMGPYGIPTDQLGKWTKSVHGQGIANGNLAAPTCPSCHGSHGATPPAINSVARVCGRCHTSQLERFLASPHARAFRQLGFPECETCHGNHDVDRTSDALVGLGPDTICSKCHTEGQRPAAVAKTLSVIIRDAHTQADEARRAVEAARREGLAVGSAELALEDVHTSETRIANVLHSFDADKLKEAAAEVTTSATRARNLVNEAMAQRKSRKHGYLVVTFLLLLHFLLVAWKIRKTDPEPEPAGPAASIDET